MSEKVTYTLCFDADQLADIIEGLQQLGRLPLAYTHAELEAAVSQTIDECGEAINEWRATPCSLGFFEWLKQKSGKKHWPKAERLKHARTGRGIRVTSDQLEEQLTALMARRDAKPSQVILAMLGAAAAKIAQIECLPQTSARRT